MKRLLAVVLVLLLSVPSFALSDAEYLRMRKSSADFARADKRLSTVWTNLKKSLPKNVFTRLQAEQREWIASGRDEAAEAYIADGYSRMEAYTMATNDRADALPGIAQALRKGTSTSTSRPKPAAKPAPARTPAGDDDGYDDSEDDGLEAQPLDDGPVNPEGEYRNNNCFMTVKILDRSTQEAEVTFGRWKDEVSWTSRGWIEDDMLELSDNDYSTCQATVVFSPNGARVSLTDSGDWAEATAEDFVMAGTYTKQ